MNIRTITISSFRNFESLLLQFGNETNVFFGDNGSGKTNLLEAIFVLLLGRSPRGAQDIVMIRDNTDVYRIEGDVYTDNSKRELAIAYQKGGRKKVTEDRTVIRISELYKHNSVVSTAPEDSQILAGPPSKRREFVNIYLSQASSKYLADLTDYARVLAQKNAYLKNGSSDACPFDYLLVQYGLQIMKARRGFLEAIASSASEYYAKISGGQALDVRYCPSVSPDPDDANWLGIEQRFNDKLEQYRSREIMVGRSFVGPHRDEVDILIRNLPARSHGSQGELRTAAVSLKLAVFDYLKKVRRVTPILLLDEIFAELDQNRQNLLIEAFGGFGQLFLTTASHVPSALSENSRNFRIKNGTVFPE